MPIVAGIVAFIVSLLISYVVFPLAGSGANDYAVQRILFTAVVTVIVSVIARSIERQHLRARQSAEEDKARQDKQRADLRRRSEKEAKEAQRLKALARVEQARTTAFAEAQHRVAQLREVQQRLAQQRREAGYNPATYQFGVVADEVLATMVWDELETPWCERTTINAEQMARLEGTFQISGLLKSQPIRDLEGIQYAKNLTALELSFLDDVRTLSPLAGLSQLKRLKIWEAAVTDIDALATLDELQELELRNLNHVTDFRPLAGLGSLTELHVSRMPDSLEFDSVSGLTGLATLTVSDSRGFNDLRNLIGLAQISELTLWDTGPVDDLTPLAQLKRLRKLTLDGIWVERPGQFAELASLASLCLRRVSGVRSLTGIERLTRLNELELDQVHYEYLEQGAIDLHPIADLRSLTTLKLVEKEYAGTFLGLEALGSLSGLTTLEVASDVRDDDIKMISRLTGLKSLSLEATLMGGLEPLVSLTRLESLSLTGKFIEFGPTWLHGLEKLAGLPSLTSLTLDTVEGYRLLDTVSKFTELKELTLRDLWLDREGEDLWPLASLTELERLELNDNYRLIPDLTPLAKLPRLTRLTLRGNTDWNTRPLENMAGLSLTRSVSALRSPGSQR